MAQAIRIKMMDKVKNVALSGNFINESSIKHAFLLPPYAIVELSFECNGMQINCAMNEAGTFFYLPEGWATMQFQIKSNKALPEIVDPSSKRQRIGDESDIADMSDSEKHLFLKLKKFCFYSTLMITENGSFDNTNTIRSIVTVAKMDCAITAAHCLPDGIPEGYQFNIFSHEDNEPVLVQLEYMNKINDFAVLKTVNKPFKYYPMGLAYPDAGTGYTLLGYHGYNYQTTTFLSIFHGHIRNNRHYADLKYVLGSPGTTRGCSGSGVFNGLALIGIVVAGRVPPLNVYSAQKSLADHVAEACIELAEPSYNHIVPTVRIFSKLEEHQLARRHTPT